MSSTAMGWISKSSATSSICSSVGAWRSSQKNSPRARCWSISPRSMWSRTRTKRASTPVSGNLWLQQVVLRALARCAHRHAGRLDAVALDADLVVALFDVDLSRRGVGRVDRAGPVVGVLRLAVDAADDRDLLRGVGL